MAVNKRKYPRVFFGLEEGFIAQFMLPNGDHFNAMIINLSGGGAGLAVAQQHISRIEAGNILLLTKIVGAATLEFLNDIQTEIKWIKKHQIPGYYGTGCEFMGIPSETREQLLKFVDAERMFRGQYSWPGTGGR